VKLRTSPRKKKHRREGRSRKKKKWVKKRESGETAAKKSCLKRGKQERKEANKCTGEGLNQGGQTDIIFRSLENEFRERGRGGKGMMKRKRIPSTRDSRRRGTLQKSNIQEAKNTKAKEPNRASAIQRKIRRGKKEKRRGIIKRRKFTAIRKKPKRKKGSLKRKNAKLNMGWGRPEGPGPSSRGGPMTTGVHFQTCQGEKNREETRGNSRAVREE